MQSSFLCEIGCEEIPTSAMQLLETAFCKNIQDLLQKHQLSYTNIHSYIAPRRMAILVQGLPQQQADQESIRQGPSTKDAYGADGLPTIACLGFIKSCNVTLDDLQVKTSKKGSWVYCHIKKPGAKTTDLLPEIIKQALHKMPVPKPMHWGTCKQSFVRPVRWLLALFDEKVIEFELFGLKTDSLTYGHRIHHPQALKIKHADKYAETLEQQGYVIPCFKKRRDQIAKQITQMVTLPEQINQDDDLLSEVTSLVEWPVALIGKFDEKYLSLPDEVLITTMKSHQKCFSVNSNKQQLAPKFCTISNLQTEDPSHIIHGNEKVIRARLEDAYFFYQSDMQHKLDNYYARLEKVTFQKGLGSVADKVKRITSLALFLANILGGDPEIIKQAALLCKCDLVTNMVTEFPELQGIMGYYYALGSKYSPECAQAIKEHYLPKGAFDQLPTSINATCLAIADRVDSIYATIANNKIPSGDKDPFALRRQALAVIRMLMQQSTAVDLYVLLEASQKSFCMELPNQHAILHSFEFIMERLPSFYHEQAIPKKLFNAVMAKNPTELLDFNHRINALAEFMQQPEAEALAAASKRVNNILKKNPLDTSSRQIDSKLLKEVAEKQLNQALASIDTEYKQLLESQQYSKALCLLSQLKAPIDAFFENVMVMSDDKQVKHNRLSLLYKLQSQLNYIADITLITD